MFKDELCGTEDRARKSIPEFLCVKESVIPGAGLGVFTKADVPIGFVFGPYQVQAFLFQCQMQYTIFKFEETCLIQIMSPIPR